MRSFLHAAFGALVLVTTFARAQDPTTNITTDASLRAVLGLKSDGSNAVTETGVYFGAHIDWNAGEKPQTLNQRIGKPASIIGGYIHLNLTNQTYLEMEDQLPSILELATTSIYSPAILPEFSLDQWTANMTATVASQMKRLSDLGITVWLRWAYEMNGAWMAFGQDPTNYVRVWQEVYAAVKAVAPDTHFMWAPNIKPTPVDGIDGYTQYYPGASFVDIAGLSFYNLGNDQVDNDLPAPGYFSSNVQSFYDLYSPAHWIVIAETSAPWHYALPPEFSSYPEDTELPGGADAVNFTALTSSEGTATSELQRKSLWFEQMTNATAVAAFPRLLAVMWFNLAKVGGYQGDLRVSLALITCSDDYRAIHAGSDNITEYFRNAVGSEAAYQASLASPSSAMPSASASGATSSSAGGSVVPAPSASTARSAGAASVVGAPSGLVGVLAIVFGTVLVW